MLLALQTIVGSSLQGGYPLLLYIMKKLNLTGQKFERLTVLDKAGKTKDRNILWNCLCDCGNKSIVKATRLKTGHTKSCGCLRNERIGSLNKSHGMRHTRFYKIYHGMKRRCKNPNRPDFVRYGNRGIKCLWSSFLEFKEDMYEDYRKHILKFGEKNTQIDRIDNDGSYYKENCRWATLVQQARNKKYKSHITFNGKTQSLIEWSEELGINHHTISTRLHRQKWSVEKTLTFPAIIGRNQHS